ncbi:diguanylate cyclase domain-containing protein [Pseudomonas sp. XS1P51]
MPLLHLSSSLQRVLLLPYIFLVLVLSLVIGLFSYQSGSQTVEVVSQHLVQEIGERISLTVHQHLSSAAVVLDAAFPENMPAPANIRENQQPLIERFWVATSLSDLNHFVYYGNRQGLSFGLLRLTPEEVELRIKPGPSEHRRIYRLSGMFGKPELSKVEESNFAPRERPWYGATMLTSKDVWTPVYIDFVTRDLVLTRAHSVLSQSGEREGVVATDVFLSMLNTFVRRLDISPNGLAFIIEPDGMLIASSRGTNVISDRYIGPQRLNAKDDPEPLVRDTYEQLRKRLLAGGPVQQAGTFRFESSTGETVHAAFNWIKDDAGLAWLTVVAVPRNDFMGDLTDNVIRTVLVALFAVIIAVLVGLYIGNWILGDITRLSIAASKIGRGQLDVKVRINRRDEIGQLARALENMQIELGTDRLTGLSNRTSLMRRMTLAILQRQQGTEVGPGQGFTLLFIDLNRFKAINDIYGHEAGDQALIEVAERLRESVRQGDLVARLGGDEFVIILWRTASREVVEQIRGKLEQLLGAPLTRLAHLAGSREVIVGAAIGVALYPENGEDAESLLKYADQRMYHDKQGRAGAEEGSGHGPDRAQIGAS